MELNGWG